LRTRKKMCPKCKSENRPIVREYVPSMPNANPPIPARLIVECGNTKCKQRYYIVAEQSRKAA